MTTRAIEHPVNSPGESASQDSQQSVQQDGAASAKGTETPSRPSQVKYVAAGTGPAYWGPGNQMTFIITGKEKGGTLFLTAKALVLITPAGLENFFAEVFDPAADRSAPPPASKELIARSLAAGPRFGLVLLPPA